MTTDPQPAPNRTDPPSAGPPQPPGRLTLHHHENPLTGPGWGAQPGAATGKKPADSSRAYSASCTAGGCPARPR